MEHGRYDRVRRRLHEMVEQTRGHGRCGNYGGGGGDGGGGGRRRRFGLRVDQPADARKGTRIRRRCEEEKGQQMLTRRATGPWYT